MGAIPTYPARTVTGTHKPHRRVWAVPRPSALPWELGKHEEYSLFLTHEDTEGQRKEA